MGRQILIVCMFFLLILSGCSSYSKYPEEIEEAYNYVHPNSKETIKNWQKASVSKYTPTEDFEVFDKNENIYVNIKGTEVLEITFNTTDDELVGPIVVYVDEQSKDIIGMGARK